MRTENRNEEGSWFKQGLDQKSKVLTLDISYGNILACFKPSRIICTNKTLKSIEVWIEHNDSVNVPIAENDIRNNNIALMCVLVKGTRIVRNKNECELIESSNKIGLIVACGWTNMCLAFCIAWAVSEMQLGWARFKRKLCGKGRNQDVFCDACK